MNNPLITAKVALALTIGTPYVLANGNIPDLEPNIENTTINTAHWRYSPDNGFELNQDSSDFTIYVNKNHSNSAWEEGEYSDDVYQSPYRVSLFSADNGEDSERLWSQTKSIGAYGLGVAGVLALMPTSITQWEKNGDPLLEKWWDNVSKGPVWDRDVWYINYLGHPYFGGVYYQSARKSGYRQWDSFIYSTLMSTFYWEYGVEAFAEVPSIQDLFVTPIMGWVYGEWAYNKEQQIRLNGGSVLGSSALGSTALFFLDPVDALGEGVNRLAGRDLVTAGSGFMGVQEANLPNGGTERQFRFQVQYDLVTTPGSKKKRSNYYSQTTQDPVTYGIVGLSAGASFVSPSHTWQLEQGFGATFSLGLHFSREFSGHLTYTRAQLKDSQTQQSVTYENYSVNALYYFNSDSTVRPFITAGVGEAMKNMDRKQKEFQVNGGLGLHYQINSNWAIQGDWRYAASTRASVNDRLTTAKLVYRFGRGE
ncbi:DUF3943 domain-containing protein [Vibrio mediterranei]|uniref:Ubiquitin-protein ligase n=1 Tax=Vibrio mediterranei TaxID=689 RepID=A0ABX5DKI4_9VIBR|nr:DUF3943 domain-containing protein [Vibrio mediterranei]PCD90192.1 ubiquitin-protein ligase [Vibrio mediterranei]PRQ69578.1 ubiquitin-protein ligase [Vibrio mediterranei]